MPRSSVPRPRSSHSPGLIASPSSSRPPPSRSAPEQDPNASSRPSTPRRLLVDGAPDGSSSQRARAITPVNTCKPNSAQMDPLVAQRRPPIYPPRPNLAGSIQHQQPPVPPHSASSLAAPLRPSLNPPILGQTSSDQYLQQPRHWSPGIFHHAQNFTARGTFVESNVTNNNAISNQFMKELLLETIPGAASDSSARDPPPRCHPGTRLAVLTQCIDFIGNCSGEKKMRWVVGAAGVGKSAVMQSVAESPNLPVTSQASVFFSVNGRNDGTKAIKTLSYQLAAKSEPYRQLIEHEIARDPALLQSSMAKQFEKLIVEPFILNPQLNSAGRVLVIIDGLDECNKAHSQLELLRIISSFCITYPTSPLVWLVASRPESHITSFFSRANVLAAYVKEEILVDSNEAREDVERFLRHELTEIKETSDSLNRYSQWPEERDLWKIAWAAGGLFAYADTAVKYIGDLTVGDPSLQLSDVLHVIENHPMDDMPREEHPMALLDALYARILSNVPPKIVMNTRKILLALATNWGSALTGDENPFITLCNWLALTPEEADSAVNHLRSVLYVPRRALAHTKVLTPYHKSFIDYISNFNRSGFSNNILREAQRLKAQCAFRVLDEAPNGIHFGRKYYGFQYGMLRCGPGTGDKISLTWPGDEGADVSDNEIRLDLYKLAVGEVAAGMLRGEVNFRSESCIRLLTTRFREYTAPFPHDTLCDLVFDESRRREFMGLRILGEIHLRAVNFSGILSYRMIQLQFRGPAAAILTCPDTWGAPCTHERKGERTEGNDQDWITSFNQFSCISCFDRFEYQLNSWRDRFPDHIANILFTCTDECSVEIKFVDVGEDTRSEWTYRFWCSLTHRERQQWGSTV